MALISIGERNDLGRHVFHHAFQIAVTRIDHRRVRAGEAGMHGAFKAGDLRIEVSRLRLTHQSAHVHLLKRIVSPKKSREVTPGSLSRENRKRAKTKNESLSVLFFRSSRARGDPDWIPACAGMSGSGRRVLGSKNQARPNTRLKIVSMCAR
jgi:hypothetical protein